MLRFAFDMVKKLLLLYTLSDPLLRWYLPAAATRLRRQSGLHVLVDHLIEEDKRQRRASEEDCRTFIDQLNRKATE